MLIGKEKEGILTPCADMACFWRWPVGLACWHFLLSVPFNFIYFQPKLHSINHGTAYCGRDTVKVLLVLLDEEAVNPPTQNKAELLYDDENLNLFGITSVLTLFRWVIEGFCVCFVFVYCVVVLWFFSFGWVFLGNLILSGKKSINSTYTKQMNKVWSVVRLGVKGKHF